MTTHILCQVCFYPQGRKSQLIVSLHLLDTAKAIFAGADAGIPVTITNAFVDTQVQSWNQVYRNIFGSKLVQSTIYPELHCTSLRLPTPHLWQVSIIVSLTTSERLRKPSMNSRTLTQSYFLPSLGVANYPQMIGSCQLFATAIGGSWHPSFS